MSKLLHLRCPVAWAAALIGPILGATSASAQVVITSNLLTNPGAETGNLNGWTVDATFPNTRPSVDNGTYDPGINPHSGLYQFVGDTYPGGGGPQGFLSQAVDVSAWTASINTGGAQAKLSFWEQSLYQGTSDYAHVQLTFRDSGGLVLGTATSPNLASDNSVWTNFSGSYAIPVGTQSILYTMAFFRANNGGTFIDSFIDDNSLKLAVPEPAHAVMAAGLTMFGVIFWRHCKRSSRGIA